MVCNSASVSCLCSPPISRTWPTIPRLLEASDYPEDHGDLTASGRALCSYQPKGLRRKRILRNRQVSLRIWLVNCPGNRHHCPWRRSSWIASCMIDSRSPATWKWGSVNSSPKAPNNSQKEQYGMFSTCLDRIQTDSTKWGQRLSPHKRANCLSTLFRFCLMLDPLQYHLPAYLDQGFSLLDPRYLAIFFDYLIFGICNSFSRATSPLSTFWTIASKPAKFSSPFFFRHVLPLLLTGHLSWWVTRSPFCYFATESRPDLLFPTSGHSHAQ